MPDGIVFWSDRNGQKMSGVWLLFPALLLHAHAEMGIINTAPKEQLPFQKP